MGCDAITLWFSFLVLLFFGVAIELNSANYEKLFIDGNKLKNGNWFVKFYAPWCGHCKNLKPAWEKAAKALKGVVKVGAVDMTTDQSVGGPYGIKGFPTLKFFGADKKKPLDYSGGRDADSIVNYALKQQEKAVKDRMGGGSKSNSSSGGG